MEEELKKKIKELERSIGDIRVALGRIERRQLEAVKEVEPRKWEFKIFSQWGEDGIIQYLIRNLDISKEVFIEFGVEDYKESNTRFLLVQENWAGLVIDGNKENIEFIKKDDVYWRYNLKAHCSFVTAENINDLIIENGICGNIGLLSIDIDGNDYWVWNSICSVKPDIVICEYNHRFGVERAVTVPYDPQFVRLRKHYSNIYYGASIKALVQLGEKKGYRLVAGNANGNNVFFVRKELLNERIKSCTVEEAFVHANFRESRNKFGSLSFLSFEQEKEILNSLEIVELDR